jgi:hypothetical protein
MRHIPKDLHHPPGSRNDADRSPTKHYHAQNDNINQGHDEVQDQYDRVDGTSAASVTLAADEDDCSLERNFTAADEKDQAEIFRSDQENGLLVKEQDNIGSTSNGSYLHSLKTFENVNQTPDQSSITKDKSQQTSQPFNNSDSDGFLGQVRTVVSPDLSTREASPRLQRPGRACYVDVGSILSSPDNSSSSLQPGEFHVHANGLFRNVQQQYSTNNSDVNPQDYVLVIVELTDKSSPQLVLATATPVYLFDKWRDWNRTIGLLAVVIVTAVATLIWTIIFSVI